LCFLYLYYCPATHGSAHIPVTAKRYPYSAWPVGPDAALGGPVGIIFPGACVPVPLYASVSMS